MNRLYEQSSLPVFQNRMYDSKEQAINCPVGDISLVQDLHTGLIYNQAFQQSLLVYDAAYQNEQGLSSRFQDHVREVIGIIDRTMGRENLVEVGCGKGAFLEMLLSAGFDVTGFDPAYEGCNPRVRRHPFQKGIGIQGRGLILRHVLEHIPDPVSFLNDLNKANYGAGRVYIEVPCLDWICEHKTWFDVFYEHVNYFRLADFHRLFGNVIESGRCFGGQYLYVVAELSSIRRPELNHPDNRFAFPSDFTAGICAEKYNTNRPKIVWGGASKGVIFSLLRARAGYPVDVVIDISPAKQGKFLAVTGLQVKPPHAIVPRLLPKDPIFVMNLNYLEEIKCMTENKFTYICADHE